MADNDLLQKVYHISSLLLRAVYEFLKICMEVVSDTQTFEVWANFAHLNSPKSPTLFQTKGSCSFFVQRYLQYLPNVLCGVYKADASKFTDEHSNALCCQQDLTRA